MAFHEPGGSALIGLLVVAVAVVVLFYLVKWIRSSFSRLGLSQGEVAAILWATFIGSFFNIPLFRFGEGFIGVNVGGAIVPVILSLYLIQRKRLPINEVLVGITLVAFVAHAASRYEPELGVVSEFPYWLLPPVTAFVVSAFAYWHEREDAASLAYVTGTLGVLVGADIVRLPLILAGPAPDEGAILSIGGAAVFDMVYLAGILAVSMETGLLVKQRQNWSRSGRANPIDAEYEAWVKRKKADYDEHVLERRRDEARRTPANRAGKAPAQKTPMQWQPARAPKG